MERKIRYAWWGVLTLLLVAAIWKFFLPHDSNVAIEKTGTNREIVVYVAGAVEKPGLVRLPIDARLNDALKQVSPLPEANVDQMNPAEKLKDGQKITVPYKPATQPIGIPNPENAPASNTAPSAGAIPGPGTAPTATVQSNNASAGSAVGVPSSIGTGISASGLININTAGVTELDKLPGVGPALAERIIQYRNENGAFSKPEDLQNVSGIGAKTYEKMASMLSVGP